MPGAPALTIGRTRLHDTLAELLPSVGLATKLTAPLLLECPPSIPAAATAQARQQARAATQARRRQMPARQRHAKHWLHVPSGPQNGLRYADLEPLHALWREYMADAFADDLNRKRAPDEHRLLKADWHGAILTVVRSKQPPLVGVSGILLQETQHLFKLIRPDDTVVVVPKAASGTDTAVTVAGAPAAARAATLRRLSASAVTDARGVSFGGLTLDGVTDGVPVPGGPPDEVVTAIDGVFSFKVFRGTAAVLCF